MLRLLRRHLKGCPHTSTKYRRCQCPIHIYGTLGGEKIRKALDLTSWEAASDLVNAWTASGQIGVVRQEIPGLKDAISKYLEDAEARHLRAPTIKKLRVLFEKQFLPWAQSRGLVQLRLFGVGELREFRATWEDAPITAYKKLERFKSFWRFCHQAGWIKINPALALKPPKVDQCPTLPFTKEEFAKILDACDRYPIKGIYNSGNRKRLKAMVLLLRYTGLRIRDAATLRKDRLEDGKLFLYTQKTGVPVWLPLPEEVIVALREVEGTNPQYWFWSGNGDPKTTVADWQRSFRKLCRLADVEGHFHRLRDTFAVSLLERGVSLEDVSILLGHSSIKVTERHYAPWVKARQQRLEEIVRHAWI